MIHDDNAYLCMWAIFIELILNDNAYNVVNYTKFTRNENEKFIYDIAHNILTVTSY